jgi:hypothetical protein
MSKIKQMLRALKNAYTDASKLRTTTQQARARGRCIFFDFGGALLTLPSLLRRSHASSRRGAKK